MSGQPALDDPGRRAGSPSDQRLSHFACLTVSVEWALPAGFIIRYNGDLTPKIVWEHGSSKYT